MSNEELQAKIIEYFDKSRGVCSSHQNLIDDITEMKDDLKEIKICLLGSATSKGLKESLGNHISNHKQMTGLWKYVIASVLIPLVALFITMYTIKKDSDSNTQKIKNIIDKNIVERRFK